jgi:hypothetical protein
MITSFVFKQSVVKCGKRESIKASCELNICGLPVIQILIFLIPAGVFHRIIVASQALHRHHIIELKL